ncbi:hypothetical protein A8F94_00470 [Bacillus sp. FJAT-27225]|uniref:hypothetical protein n=1 Tax=Bacillus sp. FJAT-27225 TaxID=1743144 RepID=UPI00080C2B67|nr:hypothetical protein [Bacillus sp. FJAT-27225]OCA90405.1 hypothetical protein A8F94_00470 [Bacillus sp. FJAT-27225]
MLKTLINKLLSNTAPPQEKQKPISTNEIEAIVEAKIKEHAETNATGQQNPVNSEDYSLTDKQIQYFISLTTKFNCELTTDPANLTLKDLNKMIAYNRFKNKGILINLEKKGVIKTKK